VPIDVELKSIIEAALLAAGRPLTFAELENLFSESERPEAGEIQAALAELAEDCRSRPVELKQVASGYRLQVREAFSPWVSRLFEERPGRYSRAFLETLAIIAYRQPVTRGEIEDIRGVAVSSGIVRTLQERGWIQVVGHKEVPGRPALLATTKQFLDYFNLKSLGELPPLQEFIDDLALQAAPQDQSVIKNADTESIE
jgi:segregation and condensation protein B